MNDSGRVLIKDLWLNMSIYMRYLKDLNWLSAPAFFLIIGMLALNSKKQTAQNRNPEKIKPGTAVVQGQKPA